VRLVHELATLKRGAPTILTIGAFDGVHRGHQFLIQQVVDRARELQCESMVITFDPRPSVVLRADQSQLTNGLAKARMITALGIDVLVLLPFTPDFASLSAGEFLASILEHIHLVEIWTGADFAFGHKREGNVQFLSSAGRDAGFEVHVVGRQQFGPESISSSAVRKLVSVGEVARAAQILGHYFGFDGFVVAGFGRGKELGFPTANVRPPSHQQLPATGIYAGYLGFKGRRLGAAISVGYNVVFGGTAIVVEAYVLDFTGDLRDAEVRLDFVDRIRPERDFASVSALISEMHRDVEEVRRILATATAPSDLTLSP